MGSLFQAFVLFLCFKEITMYCGRPQMWPACQCYLTVITCQGTEGYKLRQIPRFSPLSRRNVTYLNMRNNDISHPRGDIIPKDWPCLQTINLKENPVDCSSNFTVLQRRFNVLTDNCAGRNVLHSFMIN